MSLAHILGQQCIALQIYYILLQCTIIITKSMESSLLESTIKKQEKYRNREIISLLSSVSCKVRSSKFINQFISSLQLHNFFSEFASNFKLLSQIAQKIQLAHAKQGGKIYRVGEYSNYFYIILEGTVQLTVPEEIQVVEEGREAVLNDQQTLTNPITVKLEGAASEGRQSSFVQKIIKVIEEDGYFGEMMGERSLRATNATATENCTMLALDKKTYDLVSRAQLKTDNRSKFLFLSALHLFSPLDTVSLERICLSLAELQLTYGQYLFHEGEQVNNIYIVYEGQFKLMKAVPKHAPSSLERKIRGKSEYKSITLPTKQIPFIIVQAGEVLGDSQIFSNSQRYKEMCLCETQNSRVFCISKRQYFKNIAAQASNLENIRSLVQEKHRHRQSALHSFLNRRSRQSQMNVLLNSNEWAARPKEFRVKGKTSLNQSSHSLTSDQAYNEDSFFINQLNKTIFQNPKINRFSIKKKCHTEVTQPKLSPLIKPNKKDGVPHCVKDIVSLVKLKVNFQRRFRKQRKKDKNIFKFEMGEVPLFIKSKYNKIV